MTRTDDLSTGPEHFAIALASVDQSVGRQGEPLPHEESVEFLMQAQVHATLAQTAALVMLAEVTAAAHGLTRHSDFEAWRGVIPRATAERG